MPDASPPPSAAEPTTDSPEALRAEVGRLQEEVVRLAVELKATQKSQVAGHESRIAALNLLEDAVAAQGALEEEVVERRRAEEARRASEELYRAAEERLRLLVESSLEHAILTLDPDRRVTTWNRGAEAIFGFAASEAIGQTADVIFTEEALADDVPGKEMRTALVKGRAGDDRWMRRKNGSRFWANGAMLPMRALGDGGKVTGFVKILRDETAMHEARQALERSREEVWEALQEMEKARDEAEAANRAKDEFLGMISHELRTPLTPVPIILSVLRQRADLSPEIYPMLDRISQSVREETHLIEDLLDLSRIRHGKLTIALEPVDVHEAVRRALEVTEDALQRKEQKSESQLAAKHAVVQGDLLRLQQVFWNLLNNAVKFTPTRGRITVKSHNAGGQIVVEVIDTGIGMEPAALSKVFDAFQQADAAITRDYGGLGLGLAIAQAAVNAHGGSLQAHSEGRNRGATFVVTLPLVLPARS